MPNTWFRFKRFTIHHDRCGQKVGTDGVLIGAWANHTSPEKILDIGTGTGLVALMLAQRFPSSHLTGIEIEKECSEQAKENVRESPFSDRVEIIHSSLQDFHPTAQFDLIVSNPPFFERSLKSGDTRRDLARHTDALSPGELFRLSADVIREGGVLALVVPYDRADTWIQEAIATGWHLNSRVDVRGHPHRPPKRALLSFGRSNSTPTLAQLTLRDTQNQNTPEFSELVKEFYLEKGGWGKVEG